MGDTLEHRILLIDSGVEKERISITPLLVKKKLKGMVLHWQIK